MAAYASLNLRSHFINSKFCLSSSPVPGGRVPITRTATSLNRYRLAAFRCTHGLLSFCTFLYWHKRLSFLNCQVTVQLNNKFEVSSLLAWWPFSLLQVIIACQDWPGTFLSPTLAQIVPWLMVCGSSNMTLLNGWKWNLGKAVCLPRRLTVLFKIGRLCSFWPACVVCSKIISRTINQNRAPFHWTETHKPLFFSCKPFFCTMHNLWPS